MEIKIIISLVVLRQIFLTFKVYKIGIEIKQTKYKVEENQYNPGDDKSKSKIDFKMNGNMTSNGSGTCVQLGKPE